MTERSLIDTDFIEFLKEELENLKAHPWYTSAILGRIEELEDLIKMEYEKMEKGKLCK